MSNFILLSLFVINCIPKESSTCNNGDERCTFVPLPGEICSERYIYIIYMNRSDANEKGEDFRFDCIQPLTSLLVGERQRISCNLSALLSTKKGTT